MSSTKYSTDTSVLPPTNADYGTQQYWEKRYKDENGEVAFDWFLRPEQCLPLLRDLIPNKNARILMLGCGNSVSLMMTSGFSILLHRRNPC